MMTLGSCCKYNYIIVCPKARWTGLICLTHQHDHCQ